jgi:hypothetical protein
MSEVLDLDYEDAALVAFSPDGPRGAFLHARMIERLARSLNNTYFFSRQRPNGCVACS